MTVTVVTLDIMEYFYVHSRVHFSLVQSASPTCNLCKPHIAVLHDLWNTDVLCNEHEFQPTVLAVLHCQLYRQDLRWMKSGHCNFRGSIMGDCISSEWRNIAADQNFCSQSSEPRILQSRMQLFASWRAIWRPTNRTMLQIECLQCQENYALYG